MHEEYARLLGLVEAGLQQLALASRQPRLLYEPAGYILGLKAKRARPLLALLGWRTLQSAGTETGALNLALAVEVLHNFTLVHDDIMDQAPLRRGQPTVHTRWNPSTAILSGDALFALAFRLGIQGQGARAEQLGTLLADTALLVCEGQALDMALEQRMEVPIGEYLEMIRLKTAVLLGGSLALGGIAAGADADLARMLQRYGELCGVAFQLQDDWLDVYGDAAATGKQTGGDILQNKKTYLWLRAWERANRYQREELLYWTQAKDAPAEKIAGVKALYDVLQVPQDTERMIASYFDEAAEVMALLQGQCHTGLLAYFMQLLRERQF